MQLEGRPATADDLRSLALYNYGNFTSMRVENLCVRGLDLHLDRLAHDSNLLFGRAVNVEKVRELLREALSDRTEPVVARVTILAIDFDMSHPTAGSTPSILISVRPATNLPLPPQRIKTVEYQRDLPNVKHVGLFGQLNHRRSAQLEGYDDALFINGKGRVSEGTTWNIGFLETNHIVWPESNVLPGVTMRLLQDCARSLEIGSTTTPIDLARAKRTHAAFLTNAAVGLRPVSSIDETEYDSLETELLTELTEAYIQIEPDRI